ncbi:MAG: PKD domain-containing protein [Sulfurovum sp.]
MKNLIYLMKVVLVLVFSSVSVYGANYSCNGENIANINGATGDGYKAYSDNGKRKSSRYFKFKTAVDGIIAISENAKYSSTKHELRVGYGCGDGDIYNGDNLISDSYTYHVLAGTTYYVRVKEKNSYDKLYFNISFDFTADALVTTADAGADQSKIFGATISLDGSGSADGIGDGLSYEWSENGNVINSSESFSKNNLTVGTHTITLTVTDSAGTSDSDTVTIIITPPPIADAGANQNANLGDSVTLDGSGSTGDGLKYSWRDITTNQQLVTNSNSSSFQTSNLSNGTHTIRLTITDSSGEQDTDEVVIIIIKVCHGCDCSLDDDNVNNSRPGKIIPALNGATGDVTTCFSGDSISGTTGEKDYYYFTVATAGVLDITGTSPNGHEYYLMIGSPSDYDKYYYNDRTTHNPSSIKLKANDTVYIYIKETGNNTDEYEINLDFVESLEESCPGNKIPLLDGTGASITNRFNNIRIPGLTTYFYNFTPTIAGIFEVATNANRSSNRLIVRDGCSGEILNTNNYNYNNDNKNSGEISVNANQLIVVSYERTYDSTIEVDFDFKYTVSVPTPPVIADIADMTIDLETPFVLDLSAYVTEADGDVVTYTVSGLPIGLLFNNVTKKIIGTPTAVGTSTVTVMVSDKEGSATKSFVITVVKPELKAVADIYPATAGADLIGNVISNDSGLSIKVTANTVPSNGTVVIASNGVFTYTPLGGGNDTFTYTITDSLGESAIALVSINVSTIYKSGNQPFVLINPPETRNIIGGYTILGNTSECITNSKDKYTGTCQNSNSYNDNNYMAKYIDIDGNTGIGAATWNSSSSNFEIPTNYDQLDGKGILWAGVFWQGSINNKNSYAQRRGLVDGTTYKFKNITTNSDIDLTKTDGNRLLIRVDDDSSYTPLQATTFYYDTKFGDNGGYYAAYTDITSLMQSKNIGVGKHTVTIANLTANEGRQSSTGNYGGWSMVVIYKQDDLTGDATNVSIYNGYTKIPNSQQVKISGFRLPSAGDVHATFSTFAGEGEYVYGTPNGNYDSMVMKRLSSDSGDKMPLPADPNNIFDAKLANIDRDSGNNNDMQNNNGIDVDTYDVSTIITKYRDIDKYVGTIYISLSSNNDYITPSMMAFSTALYQPNICYDYSIDIGGFIIPSEDNKIKTTLGAYGTPLSTKISILSKEGDFELHDVNITYKINDTQQLHYVSNSTGLAQNDRHSYIPAGPTGLNQTYQENISGFGMYIGTGAGTVPIGPGGIIDSYEARYLTFDTEMMQSSIDTSFKLWIEYSVDYGSGPVHLSKGFGKGSICPASGGYFPAWGIFNVTSDDASLTTGQPYNLYTQVANRAFNARIFSYGTDYVTPKVFDSTVEVEVYNAGILNRDTNVSCYNPDSNISAPVFVKFNNSTSTPILGLKYNLATQNTGFRTWFLTSPSGGLVEQNCGNRNNESCFQTVYKDNYPDDDNCTSQCSAGGQGCYACLRTHYGRILCSRDNFAIRPEAFATKLIDSNQSNDALNTNIRLISDSTIAPVTTPISLAADYNYRFDTIATDYRNDNPVHGYFQTFNESISATSTLQWNQNPTSGNDISGCVDTNDTNLSMSIANGTNTADNISSLNRINQVGDYFFALRDSNWTSADWDTSSMVHHDTNRGFLSTPDCLVDKGDVNIEGVTGRHGCMISSNHTHPIASKKYRDFDLQFYPYSFNLDAIQNGARPSQDNNNNTFVYINTLDSNLYQNGIDENMSFNIYGTFTAAGYNGLKLTNFVNSCYAENVDLILNYRYLSNPRLPNNQYIPTPALTYDLIEYNSTTTPNIVTRVREQDTFATSTANNTPTELKVEQVPADFSTNAEGAISMDWSFNFNRNISKYLNPRLLNFIDLNIIFETQPSNNLGSQGINVDLDNTHLILGNKIINQNITFLYARTKSSKKFYEDVIGVEIATPISIVNYCNLGVLACRNLGIDTDKAQTGETSWWLSTDHSTLDRDGNIVLVQGIITEGSGSSPTITPTTVFILGDGQELDIVVNTGTTPVLPLTVPINLETNNTIFRTSRWLVFDPFANIAPSSLLYRVRFLGASNWGGFGDRGSIVDTVASEKKTKRLDW